MARSGDRPQDPRVQLPATRAPVAESGGPTGDPVVTRVAEPRGGASLLEQLPIVSYIAQYDDPRALEYVSPQADALLGFTGREIAFWQTRLVDDDRAVFDAAASAVRNTREPVSVEYRLLDRDEHVVWVRDTAVVAVGADGDLTVQGFLTDVTREKQLELELAREREQTDAFFRDSSVGMVITDAEGRFVRVNEALAAISGISVEDHVGKRLRELLPVVADHVEPLLEEVWRTGKPVMGREIGVEIEPGRALHSLVSYFPVNTAGAKQFGGIVVDTSDFHRSVDARATTEREHRRLIEKLPLVVYVNTLSGTGLGEGRRTSYISPQVEQLFGYPPSAWFADDILWDRLVHPDDRALVREAEIRADGGQTECEYRIVRPDGTIRWVLDAMYTECNDAGTPLFEQGFIFDVTDRKRAEAAELDAVNALRASEKQFRAVFDNALDAMVLGDDEGRYVDVNAAACELFGMTRAELMAPEPPDGEAGAECRRVTAQNLIAEGRLAGATPIERRDGTTREVEFTATANVLPGRHLSVLRDVTDRKQLEQALWQAQKLESVGTLAGGIAHDFNNMLMAISGYSSLLLGRLPVGSVERHHVEEIEQAAARAAKLTAQLLAFGRRQVLLPQAVDLCTLVTELVPMLERAVGATVSVTVDAGPGVCSVIADPAKVEQVILNVVVNAAEAMPDGGRVTLGMRGIDVEHDVEATNGVTARELTAGRYVELSISDSGSGMDGETLEHVFEPFFTTKTVGNGDGLGLSTAYGIVKQSGGTVVAQSTGGSGTTFRIYLPVAAEAENPNGGHETA
jgi:PAS domain S-box-containing protein